MLPYGFLAVPGTGTPAGHRYLSLLPKAQELSHSFVNRRADGSFVRWRGLLLKESLNLRNQKGQVWRSKGQFWSRDSMVLYVWRNMFVVRKCCCQNRVIRMRKIVVPVQSCILAIHFVSIRGDETGFKINLLTDS
ncbi:MAG: hypothetical protein D6796_02285 [Caldilineae bacterium]|nr:MAG: hypothetical protein D6796_02285 [Caldilineae bacterium]